MRPWFVIALVVLLLVIVLWSVIDDATPDRVPATPPHATVRLHTEAAATPVTIATSTSTSTSTSSTTATATPSARRSISSTGYCETGVMANGQPAHDGAVSSKVLRRGSRWRVLTGPYAGRVFTVEDTGSLAIFDIAMPGRCAAAVAYGRREISIEAA